MAKMHPVEAKIAKIFGVKRGPKDSDKKWKLKLHDAASDESVEDAEEKWDDIGEDGQAWVNAMTDARDNDEDLPEFDVGGKSKSKSKSSKDDDGEGDSGEDDNAGEDDEGGRKSNRKGGKSDAKGGKDKDKGSDKKSSGRKSSSPVGKPGDGYKGHRSGSRKEKIHRIFDEKGADAAFKAGEKEELSQATIRTWIGSWGGVKKGGAKKSRRDDD
jgi:hypothetical protein